jgi:hypothetical protein
LLFFFFFFFLLMSSTTIVSVCSWGISLSTGDVAAVEISIFSVGTAEYVDIGEDAEDGVVAMIAPSFRSNSRAGSAPRLDLAHENLANC